MEQWRKEGNKELEAMEKEHKALVEKNKKENRCEKDNKCDDFHFAVTRKRNSSKNETRLLLASHGRK